MAISYGQVSTKGDFGRVYDVNLASADTTGTIDLTQTVQGVATGMQFDPTVCLITPMNVVLTADQVLAANGGGGAAGTFSNGTLCYASTIAVTSFTADSIVFAKTAGQAASFRVFVGRLYQQHN